MRISDLLKHAFRNLMRRKARTALTIIGMIIGTVSIMVMVSIDIGVNKSFDTYEEIRINAELKETSDTLQMVLGIIGGVAMLVSAINIANTMVMAIYERTKEIGIMKVLGCTVRDIKRQFLLESGLLGLCGGIIGIALSYLVSYLLNTYGKSFLGSFLGTGAMGVCSIIPVWLPFAAAAFGILIGVISGYFPAERATRIRAIEAMKTEG